MTTRAPFNAPTPEERIALREADHLGQSRRTRSRDHKVSVAARRADERRRNRLDHLSDEAAARRSFRKFKNSMLRDARLWKPIRLRLEQRIPARPNKKKERVRRGLSGLPSVGFDVVDSKGRRGVFLSICYDGAKTTDRGVFRRRIEYGLNSRDVVLAPDGRPMLVSNVAKDPDEAVALADEIEAFARAERLNGKVCFNLVIGFPRAADARQRELILRRFCQRSFADQGLPFMALNHEPKRAGKVHNPHGHITASFRPVHREGPYRYLISKDLRVDLDGEEGMARMRRILAQVTTQVMRESGFNHEYTHLSNAARGIALVAQEGLSKEQSEAAKRGEIVAGNERNKVLAERARAYVLKQIEKTVEQSKAALLAKLPWALTRPPQLAGLRLRAAVPRRVGTLLGLRQRSEFIRVQLTKNAPATTLGQVPKGLSNATVQALLHTSIQLRPTLLLALACTRPVSAVPDLELPVDQLLPRTPQTAVRSVAAKSESVTTSSSGGSTTLPRVRFPHHIPTAPSVKYTAQKRRVKLVAEGSVRSTIQPRLNLPPFPSRANIAAFAAIRRSLLEPIKLPTKAGASIDQTLLKAQRIRPVSSTTRAARLPTNHLVRAPEFMTKVRVQPVLPQSTPVSLAEGLRPSFNDALTIGLRPFRTGQTPPIKLSKQAAADHPLAGQRRALMIKIAAKPPKLLSVPLVPVPARKSIGIVAPVSAPSQSSALLQLITAPALPTQKPLLGMARPAPKALLVPVITPVQLARNVMRAAPILLAAMPRVVGKSLLVELPSLPSADGFERLRAQVDAMRSKLTATQSLEPSRMNVEKEKADQRPQSTRTVVAPGNSHLDQLCRAFFLAKTGEDRRIAAVQIRKNKAAVEAMNVGSDPLWTAEQNRFQAQQAGAGHNTQWGR